MNWLQERLNELNYTHQDLQQKLAEKNIHRVRATITGWTNDKSVSLLNDPAEAKILADVLDWSVLDMLVAADYDVAVPKELTVFIEEYRKASGKRRGMFLQNLEFVMKFLEDFGEDQLDEPEPGDGRA